MKFGIIFLPVTEQHAVSVLVTNVIRHYVKMFQYYCCPSPHYRQTLEYCSTCASPENW